MSTQLLEARPTGAEAQQTVSGAMAPEPVNPACKRLQKALGDYQKLQAEILDCRGKVSRVQADEDELLGDPGISEKESIQRIPEFASRKKFHEARGRAMEARAAGLLAELRRALVAANAEIIPLVIREVDRRCEILTRRVLEAIGGLPPHAVIANSQIGSVVRQSRTVWSIQRYQPSPLLAYHADKMEEESVVASAQSLLLTMEGIVPEIGGEI